MAFFTKTDYSGLATTLAGLRIKDETVNTSWEKYQPQGQDGSFIGLEVYGEDSAPTNTYGVASNLSVAANTVVLGKITTVGDDKYSLESLTINTAAGSAPTVNATSQKVESTADDADACQYKIPAFNLSTKQHAQILFDAFTLSGTGCVLTDCNATIGCSVNKEKVAGVTIASDINSGVITVTGTILQTNTTGNEAPTITPASGWVLTQAPNCTNPETSYKTYSFEVVKNLVKG